MNKSAKSALAFSGVGCSTLGFSGTCMAGLPKTEWVPHDPIGMGSYSFNQNYKNFYKGGVPGFRILWDRKSWVSKDQVATYISATTHSECTLSEF